MHTNPNERSCLPCNACCQGWLEISEVLVHARPGHACSNCSSQGCAIYESRPLDPCQTFYCAWRQADTPLVDDMRPDLAGVIVIMDRMVWRGQKVIVAIPTEEKIPDKSLNYLRGLSNLMGLNLLTVQFLVVEGQFTGAAKLFAFGQADFNQDMREQFKDGKPDWLSL